LHAFNLLSRVPAAKLDFVSIRVDIAYRIDHTINLNALLIYPEFSRHGFWNYKEVCRIQGAKYPAAPLGLITLAALLPQDWSFRLSDLNTAALQDSDIQWADLVFIGGMLPQQVSFLKLIDHVHRLGKRVVAGGPDPTSQPEIYRQADFLVLGEAECTLPRFLTDFQAGAKRGVYLPRQERPDIRSSPVPRFDLLRQRDYLMIGIQFSRGCPFNCEFCDVIELFGRIPRTKAPEQIIAELQALYELGYRGHVDFVDDNFIGNIKSVKRILTAVRGWSERRRYPFYFSTEASINLADDPELLGMMRDLDFRYVFIGIESSDEEILRSVHKMQNTRRRLTENLTRIYRHGMIVNGGFIIGFDGETRAAARSIAEFIRRGSVCMAMVGLLHALPNTQLTRRLKLEKRFLRDSNELINSDGHGVDQTTAGLNFTTLRPRRDILKDYLYVVGKTYGLANYFNRCLTLGRLLKPNYRHKPSLARRLRDLRGLIILVIRFGVLPPGCYYFWRNILLLAVSNPLAVEAVINLMAMYLHFRKQTRYARRILS
jgi:radical SAM superfamily enzyme YgiQ (UPF0313 family)